MSDLNPGIVKLVEWLNLNGFVTVDSGDGSTHDFECDRRGPYVVIQLNAPAFIEWQCSRLVQLLKAEGVKFSPRRGVAVQANYSPLDKYAFIEVTGLTDADIWPKLREVSDVE